MGAEQTENVFASGELLATETGELSQGLKQSNLWTNQNSD